MPALAVIAEIDAVDDVFDDLPERERYYCEIVAAKSQNRDADEKAEDARRDAAAEHTDYEPQRLVSDAGKELAEHNAGECADAHKARVTEAEVAAEADDDVQRDGGGDVNAHGDKLPSHGAAEIAR